MKTIPVTNQQLFTLEVHITAMETEFGAVFHDTLFCMGVKIGR